MKKFKIQIFSNYKIIAAASIFLIIGINNFGQESILIKICNWGGFLLFFGSILTVILPGTTIDNSKVIFGIVPFLRRTVKWSQLKDVEVFYLFDENRNYTFDKKICGFYEQLIISKFFTKNYNEITTVIDKIIKTRNLKR